MDSFIAQQNRLRQRRAQKSVLQASGSPFEGVVTSDHNSSDDTVNVSYYAGSRKVPTLHPYTGTNCWVRVGAESGVPVVMAQRPDANQPDLLSYRDRPENVKARVESYQKGVGLYRPLYPGELELHSSGVAQTFYSSRPVLEQRGGLIRHWLDQDNLEAGSRSPLHVRQCHLNLAGQIGDEERFGVVQRYDESGVTQSKVSRKFIRSNRLIDPFLGAAFGGAVATSGVLVEPGPWAKEYLRVLSSGAATPSKLVDYREGDCVDDVGNVMMLTTTGQPLRLKGEWFTDAAFGGAFFVGVDNQGNFSLSLPDEATAGGNVAIPGGDLQVTIGKSYVTTVSNDYVLSTSEGGMSLECQDDYGLVVREGSAVFRPSERFDVGGADEPAVLGNVAVDLLGQLLDLFLNHFHTGNLGGPTPLDPGGVATARQLKANFIDNRQILSDFINLSKKP